MAISQFATMAAMRQIPLTCSGHTRPVVYLAFSQITPNGYFLISACKDGKPMLRQGETGDWIGTFVGHKGAVWGVALNKDATKAATGAADFMAKLWDSVSGEELHSFTHQHIVKCVHFDEDGTHLLTGSNEKLLRIFDIEKPEADPQVFSGHTSAIKQALFLNDSKSVLSASDDKTIRMWDRVSGQEIRRLDLPGSPTSMDVSSDGTVMLATYGSMVSFWDTESFSVIKEINVPTNVNSASLHPQNTVFVCGGDDFKMCKYDYETGNLLDSFKGHFGPIHCVRFSPDGELYASGSEDGTLRLWQTNVGQNYGLWRCVTPGDTTSESTENIASGNIDGQQLKAEA